MRRSKLEIHADILKILARHGPIKLTHIMYEANINCKVLKQHLDLLIQHNLVEEQNLNKHKNSYALTKKGRTALKYFRKLNKAFQITARAL